MKIIQQANRAARDNVKKINELIKRDTKRVSEVIKTLQRAGININHVYLDSSSYNVSVTGTRTDLDIMFGVLRRAGLIPRSRPAEKQTDYCAFWNWSDDVVDGYLWVSFSSTTCKRVQVGTRMEEVPVYETVCEE
jgi:hypothetical protein